MKIAHTVLCDAIRKRIDLLKERVRTDTRNRHNSYVRTRIEYIADHTSLWSQFAENIQACLENNEPVTRRTVPVGLRSGFSDGVKLFDTKLNVPAPPEGNDDESWGDYYRNSGLGIADLELLLTVLNSVKDEEISTYALDKLGIDLKKLLRVP